MWFWFCCNISVKIWGKQLPPYPRFRRPWHGVAKPNAGVFVHSFDSIYGLFHCSALPSLSLALCKPLYYVHEVAMKYVVYWVSLSNIWELVCSHNRQWSEGWLLSSSSHANSTSKRHAAIQFKCHEKEQNWPKYAFPFKPYIIKLICLSLKSAVGIQESMYIFIFSCNVVLFWR